MEVVPQMDAVCALLLVGGRGERERFAGVPLALLDVLGRSVLLRTADRLRAAGVGEIAVLSDSKPQLSSAEDLSCDFRVATSASFWSEAWQEFRQLSREWERVLVVRLGAWAEVDYATMVEEHARLGSTALRACSRRGQPLDIFCVSASGRAEAAALLRSELRDERIAVPPYIVDGYTNMLSTPEEFRELALDALAGEAELRPCGREARPGVWVGNGARVHPQARVVAPAFIGECVTVRRGAVITRGSALEHHVEVDCASMVDGSTALPYTRIGAGLDVEQSIAGFHKVHSLLRGAMVEIEDASLIGATESRMPARMLTTLSGMLALLPNVLWRALFAADMELHHERRSEPLTGTAPPLDPALAPAETQSKYSGMATRPYGND